jgi:hypothetical protein
MSIFSKKGDLMHEVIIQVIFVGLVFAIFFYATADKVNAREVKQQVLEKQTALLIDSAISGMSFEIFKNNINGVVNKIEIKNGRVYIAVSGMASINGYPYFSKYSVSVEEIADKFIVRMK